MLYARRRLPGRQAPQTPYRIEKIVRGGELPTSRLNDPGAISSIIPVVSNAMRIKLRLLQMRLISS
jgi:hypothetical protein